ncbi:MAG TPA: cupin domain-containing protein [Oceanospirillaceae bacterium]|nr:cupin domain-containing protein [Oceanospirillaceae bacterium]
MTKSQVISLAEEFAKLTFVGDRVPGSTDEQLAGAFSQLAPYRDGAIFIGHYAGNSDWERHAQGDEIVYVVVGETTLTLLTSSGETPHLLQAGELMVVPQKVWHRFETPVGVKILTVTPQPTDHCVDRPQGDDEMYTAS